MPADLAAGPAGGPAREPLEVLLAVQDLDTQIGQLQHRRATLAERAELTAAEAKLAELAGRAASMEEERRALVQRQEALEAEIGVVSGRRDRLEQKMYAARGSPARELQAMDDEIGRLSERCNELEEAALEVMEDQEPLDASLAVLGDERTQLSSALLSLRAALDAAEAVVDLELSTLASTRQSEASRLPADLYRRYETLRVRLGGVGAARLVGTRCSGCHLELPAVEVERVRHLAPGAVATCDQCGRILVPLPAHAGPDPSR